MSRQADLAAPSRWVNRFLDGFPPGGRVLDVACGSGRHLAAVLASGRRVVGVDRDIGPARAALGAREGLELIAADLEDGRPFPFAPGSFDGVIVTNYLWRPILPAIVATVADDGVLIYETFGIGQERLGRPSNPAFLLRPGELLESVTPRLRVIAFEHVHEIAPDRIVQRICAVGPRHHWPAVGAPGV